MIIPAAAVQYRGLRGFCRQKAQKKASHLWEAAIHLFMLSLLYRTLSKKYIHTSS